jgi:hypothetical protein
MRFIKIALSVLVLSVFVLTVDTGLAEDKPIAGDIGGYLGKVDFPVSCDASVQGRFNRSLALLHNMMYRQAEKEFGAITEQDPDCAMAYWGIAMTLFNPLWAEPKEDELIRGSEAVRKAEALKPPTEREKYYIKAVKAYFTDWKTRDHRTRIAAWEAAQERVYRANPGDIDAGALYALSLLATAPKGDKTFKNQKKAGALLEKLRETAPEHPGLFHYTIHAYDNPMLASRAMEAAQGYARIAPSSPHAQHMPSHIFVRMGLWSNVIEWNQRSAAAAREQSEGGILSLHYIHAMDYLIYAHLQRAQDSMARDALAEINEVDRYQDSFVSAYGIAAAQARYLLERGKWAKAAKLPLRTHGTFPWDKYPWHESITYFARGLGAARSGDAAAAQDALETLDKFHERSVKAGQKYWAVLLDAQRKAVAAWAAFAEGKKDGALEKMREAADIEDSVDKHPVTPGAVLPARELLGDMLILLERPGEALEAYEVSLAVSQNRLNSLYGAGHAAELMGEVNKTRSYYSRVVEIAADADSDRPRIRKARAFLVRD